jgi:hypothetical protein
VSFRLYGTTFPNRALAFVLAALPILALGGCAASVGSGGTGGGSKVTAVAITTQPASQAVSVGQTATFTVGATGSGPMMYQWQKNATAIPGATASSYTTPA